MSSTKRCEKLGSPPRGICQGRRLPEHDRLSGLEGKPSPHQINGRKPSLIHAIWNRFFLGGYIHQSPQLECICKLTLVWELSTGFLLGLKWQTAPAAPSGLEGGRKEDLGKAFLASLICSKKVGESCHLTNALTLLLVHMLYVKENPFRHF